MDDLQYCFLENVLKKRELITDTQISDFGELEKTKERFGEYPDIQEKCILARADIAEEIGRAILETILENRKK